MIDKLIVPFVKNFLKIKRMPLYGISYIRCIITITAVITFPVFINTGISPILWQWKTGYVDFCSRWLPLFLNLKGIQNVSSQLCRNFKNKVFLLLSNNFFSMKVIVFSKCKNVKHLFLKWFFFPEWKEKET